MVVVPHSYALPKVLARQAQTIAEYARKADVEREAVRDFGCLLLSTTVCRLPPIEMDDDMRDLTTRLAQNLLFTELEKIEDITEFINRTLIDG